MTRLHELFADQGQSPWIDDLHRGWLLSGHLGDLVSSGVRGVTSNPTIFAKAIEAEDVYDDQLAAVLPGRTIEEAYWELVIADVSTALDVLAPVYEAGGTDGFVSLEVSPALANDTEATIEAARELHDRIAKPNLLVKVPATPAGVPAIQRLIAEGRSINVTLIFGLDRYDAVMEAYLSGLEEYLRAGGTRVDAIASVASFFVSRVDTEVDRRLERLAGGTDGDEAILALRGKAGVAQAQEAYQHFLRTFSGPRWEALAAKGARVQRPLWASTSTKNPAYPDLLYVDNLIGPHTVNTMPEGTLQAFLDHGTVARTVDADPDAAAAVLSRLADAGIDFGEVSQVLEEQGVRAFATSFEDLLGVLSAKAPGLVPGAVGATERSR